MTRFRCVLSVVLIASGLAWFGSGAAQTQLNAAGLQVSQATAPDGGTGSRPAQNQREAPAAPDVRQRSPRDNPPPATAARGQQAPSGIRSGGRTEPQPQVTYKTPYEYYLTLLTIALSVAVISGFCIMQWKFGPSPDFSRSFIVITVIFAALFLIVAGYSDQQTAPVFGLLGSIVGYVFGRATSPPPSPGEPCTGGPPPEEGQPDTRAG